MKPNVIQQLTKQVRGVLIKTQIALTNSRDFLLNPTLPWSVNEIPLHFQNANKTHLLKKKRLSYMNTSFEGHFKWPGEGWLIPQLFCRQWCEEHQQHKMMAGKKKSLNRYSAVPSLWEGKQHSNGLHSGRALVHLLTHLQFPIASGPSTFPKLSY